MFKKSSLPKVLLLLAGFVFFSGNSIYFLETETLASKELFSDNIHFNFETALKNKPYLNARSVLLINYENGNVLYNKKADTPRPIASISKLVTAMVLIDNNIDLNKVVTISKQDAYRSSKSRLRSGYQLTVRDLLHASLLSSDNRAARALARTTSGSIEAFAKEMNQKMKQLGLKKSVFYEPTGLDKRNVSTAHEVAKILHYASKYQLIQKITSKKTYYVKVTNRKNKKLQMVNTNLFIHSPYKVLTGKTGYIQAADYCLTTLIRNRKGERLALVVLGVPGDKLRFREARRLVDWGYKQI